MRGQEDRLKPVSPSRVLADIAGAIPANCRSNMIIVGSLAVGYHYFGDRNSMVVRTKDADCLLSPRVQAVPVAVKIVEKLIHEGWHLKEDTNWGTPGDMETPDEELPVVRLQPPDKSDWFIELLTAPDTPAEQMKRWVRLNTSHGHFALCSFEFLSLASYKPNPTRMGILVARPEMMALANSLEHPSIEPQTMSGGFASRMDIKRSNKDLGRVLAIARLALGRDEDALLNWPESWKLALQDRFPDSWRRLARRTGQGLRVLMASEPDLEQAWYTCVNGLLASDPPTLDALLAAGKRLLKDAVEPLENGAE